MTSSSGSTTRNRSTRNRIALLGITLLLGGCASKTVPTPPRVVNGYVSLPALVRTRPGWAGLAQYDAALARLDRTVSGLPAAGTANPKLALLPALQPSSARSAGAVPGEGAAQRLAAVQESLTGSLEERRRMARAEQIRRQQALWRREARRLFPVPARTTELSSDLTLQLLEANVAALTQTLNHWDTSMPPAPKLVALRIKVEADRSRLQALIAGRIRTRDAARAARLEAVRSMREARVDYAAAQGAALSARLLAEDTRVLAAQSSRLTAQRLQLLVALSRPEGAEVPVSGNAGALSLPRGPLAVRPSLSAASLAAARATLLAQRGRWSRYLTDDTVAAARDAAGQKNWNITFGPPRRGDQDLTAEMARALARD